MSVSLDNVRSMRGAHCMMSCAYLSYCCVACHERCMFVVVVVVVVVGIDQYTY